MGLFDTITWEALVDEADIGEEFQTKSFEEPSLAKYRVDQQGRLLLLEGYWKFQPINVEPFVCYTFRDNRWIEYHAAFFEGHCVEVRHNIEQEREVSEAFRDDLEQET